MRCSGVITAESSGVIFAFLLEHSGLACSWSAELLISCGSGFFFDIHYPRQFWNTRPDTEPRKVSSLFKKWRYLNSPSDVLEGTYSTWFSSFEKILTIFFNPVRTLEDVQFLAFFEGLKFWRMTRGQVFRIFDRKFELCFESLSCCITKPRPIILKPDGIPCRIRIFFILFFFHDSFDSYQISGSVIFLGVFFLGMDIYCTQRWKRAAGLLSDVFPLCSHTLQFISFY